MQRVGRRAQGYYDAVLHTVSKEVVTAAGTHGCTVIAIEDLSGIRDRFPGDARFHAWAFRQLSACIRYKARVTGIDVVQVNPAHTSQRCSRCGHTARANRRSQADFACTDCGYEVNADDNAAKNVGLRYLRTAQTSASGGAPVGVPLNSGTLTVDDTYVPDDGLTQAERPR